MSTSQKFWGWFLLGEIYTRIHEVGWRMSMKLWNDKITLTTYKGWKHNCCDLFSPFSLLCSLSSPFLVLWNMIVDVATVHAINDMLKERFDNKEK